MNASAPAGSRLLLRHTRAFALTQYDRATRDSFALILDQILPIDRLGESN